jgi:transcriptional regulator with XRE-family HTH domain
MSDVPITPEQVKAARELLGWTRMRLAFRVGVSEKTVLTFESGEPWSRPLDLGLEAAGVEFIAENAEGPGVRLIYFVDSRRLMSANYGYQMYCVRPRTEAGRKVAMPTYFFDLIKGNELVEDDQGDDFADIEAAKLEGLASARELLADAAKKGILATSPVYLIRNAVGDILATIPFKDALKPD